MTPKRLVVCAAALVAIYAVLDVAGGRGATTSLSGSVPGTASVLFGVVYMLFYFGAVLVAPPMVLTAGALAAVDVLRAGTKEPSQLR